MMSHAGEEHQNPSLIEAPKEIAGHGLLTDKVVVVTAAAGTGIGTGTAPGASADADADATCRHGAAGGT